MGKTSMDGDIMKKKAKIRDLESSEIDRLDNIALAAQALIEEEIRSCNEDSAILTSGTDLVAAREVIKALRELFYGG